MDESEREALHSAMHRLEQRWLPRRVPRNDVWHAWDPLPFWEFLAGVREAAGLTAGRRFLDIGCGIGTKLAVMHALGWTVAGVEKRKRYVNAAAELVPEAVIVHADVLDVDRFDADLVYMYRPAVADELESRVEAHVLGRVTPGSVLFWPYRHDPQVWVV